MNVTKRIICLMLALCCMLSMAQGLSLRADAYASAKPLPELTGNKGQDVANIAISQLGYGEDSRGGTVYGAWWTEMTNWGYDYTRAGWCAIFAMWCAHYAGAGMEIAFDKRGAVPQNCMNWLLTNASGDTTFSTAPAPGDFIFFGYGSSVEHVAIVVAYDRATNKVTFVGGNQGNKVTQFTMSYTASAKYGSQRIVGIGRPKYGSSAIVPTCSCEESYAGYYQCITESDSLNMRSGHGTAYSVVGSIPPGATVYISKAQGISDGSWAHVEYNGVKGYCSMQYLKRLSEYDVEVIYDEHTGNVTGANVEIYDHVTVDEMTLTLPEQLVVNPGETSALIRITANSGFLLNLEIPLVGDFSGVKPMILDAVGNAIYLEEYSLTENGVLVTVAGTVKLQLVNEAESHTHDYTALVTKQPGCEVAGETSYACACGHSYTEAIAATGHTEGEAVREKESAATCGAAGGYDSVVYCAVCSEELSRTTVTLPATGEHDYTTESERMDATCTDDGYYILLCSCGAVEEVTIDALGHSYANGVCGVCGEEDPDFVKTVILSGSYKSFGNAADTFTILLIPVGAEEAAYTFINEDSSANSGTWSIAGVLPGSYTVQVMKKNHITREYTITIGDSDGVLDVEAWLVGDVNGDGLVNFSDYSKILKQSKAPSAAELTGYAWLCGDVTGDNMINFSDYGKVLAQAKGSGNLWLD